MKKVLLLCAFLTGSALAATPTLHGQTGTIPVLGGKVTVQATPTLRHLNAADARTVIVDEWGNPPEAADDVLGLLVPGGTTPGAQDSWAIVMTENRDGHVSDADAARPDYADLLRGMQDRVQEGNAERVKAGYEPITLVGWAEPPSYDAAQHKMIWARELAFGTAGTGDHTLNYAVRVLGRDDVLELNAVGAASQLVQIRQVMQSVLPNVTFTAGHRYEDYSEGSDRLAAYGIAGLVAGGVAAKKLGLLALLPFLVKKGWILILAGLALLSRIKRSVQSRLGTAPAPVAASGVPTPDLTPPQVTTQVALQDTRHTVAVPVNFGKPGDLPS